MKVLVVEDSRLAREGLVRLLGAHPQLVVVGQADHPDSALALVAAHHPEVLFLDIHMPGASGFDLLERLDYMPRIVFTTAYAEYAIRSFDFNTVDYLLKPISAERLAVAVGKLLAGEDNPVDTLRAPLELDSKIFVKDGAHCHLIALSAISYIESCKNYVQIFFGQQHAYVKKSMNAIEERLPRQAFFRASRQHIVNLQAVTHIEESIDGGYTLTLNNGKRLDVSRRNASQLKDVLSL